MVESLCTDIWYEIFHYMSFEGLVMFSRTDKLNKSRVFNKPLFIRLLKPFREFDEECSLKYLMSIYRRVLEKYVDSHKVILKDVKLRDNLHFQLYLYKFKIVLGHDKKLSRTYVRRCIDFNPRFDVKTYFEYDHCDIFITDEASKVHCFRCTYRFKILIDNYLLSPEEGSMTIKQFSSSDTKVLKKMHKIN
jgi:hypothetical protein